MYFDFFFIIWGSGLVVVVISHSQIPKLVIDMTQFEEAIFKDNRTVIKFGSEN